HGGGLLWLVLTRPAASAAGSGPHLRYQLSAVDGHGAQLPSRQFSQRYASAEECEDARAFLTPLRPLGQKYLAKDAATLGKPAPQVKVVLSCHPDPLPQTTGS